MPKVVPTESDHFGDTSDAAQGGAHVEAISAPIATRVEQTPQGGEGVVSSATTPLPDSEKNVPGERGIDSTAHLPAEEEEEEKEDIPPLNRSLNPSDPAAIAVEDRLHSPSTNKEPGGGVLDASNASEVSNTVPEPGASKDKVDTDSLLNPSIKPPESQDGQQYSVNKINDEGSNENEAGGSARVLPTPNLSETDKHGDGGGDSTGNFNSSHPNVDTASSANDDKSPADLTRGEQDPKNINSGASSPKNDSGASSPSNNTLDTEECKEGFKHAGAVFARRGTRRPIPRWSSQDTANKLASEKRPSFRAPPAMYMGHPVGSPAAEFLERHERRVKEAAVRRASVSDLLKLVMNHDPVSSGSPMPDVDVVFPDYHSDQNEGDWFV